MRMTKDHIARCHECRKIVAWASYNVPDDDVDELIDRWSDDGLQYAQIETEAAMAEDWGHSDGCQSDWLQNPRVTESSGDRDAGTCAGSE